eukprot:TRINITY_DN7833_c0_g1_i1.p2 TRINITY_DN7833_c0_g1~~TRINITY_DN7833_c0_g1_i1.p2  ORF type:complete len:148 (-),score=34.57 TRINITY_DN7833_c0_g1_i1:30-473(-)
MCIRDRYQRRVHGNLMYSFAEMGVSLYQKPPKSNQIIKKLDKNLDNLEKMFKINLQALQLNQTDGIVHLLKQTELLQQELKSVILPFPDNHYEIKEKLMQVLNKVDQLYETAIVQRNLKQGQNAILEKKQKLTAFQSACLEVQKILE